MLPVREHVALSLYLIFLFFVIAHAKPTDLRATHHQSTSLHHPPENTVMGQHSPLYKRMTRLRREEAQKQDDTDGTQTAYADKQTQLNSAQTCAGENCPQQQSARPEDRSKDDDDTSNASRAGALQETPAPPAPSRPDKAQRKKQEQPKQQQKQQQQQQQKQKQKQMQTQNQKQATPSSPPGPLSKTKPPSEQAKPTSSPTPNAPTGGSTAPFPKSNGDNDGSSKSALKSSPPSPAAAAPPTASPPRNATAPQQQKKKPKKPRPVSKVYVSGKTVTIETADDFCLMLPSSPGNKDEYNGQPDPEAIQRSEKSATAFCTSQSSIDAVPGARPMPVDFIQSAALSRTDAYVQVTGTINPSAYELSPEDGGGQYDDHGAGSPPESHCKNYPYYVALVEPDVNRFCIRCCNAYEDCNAGRSAYGCGRVVPE